MTCQYREQPDDSPCYSTATHRAEERRAGFVRILNVCLDHALELDAQGCVVRSQIDTEDR